MIPIKYLLCFTETSFHWLWQLLMSNSDELNLAQDRSTWRFSVLTDSQKSIEMNLTKKYILRHWMISYVYFTGKCFEFRICSFYENSNFKKCSGFAHRIWVSEIWEVDCWNNLVFIELWTSDLSKFINMKILLTKLGKERQCHITKQLVHSFSVSISQPSKVIFTLALLQWTSVFSGGKSWC